MGIEVGGGGGRWGEVGGGGGRWGEVGGGGGGGGRRGGGELFLISISMCIS